MICRSIASFCLATLSWSPAYGAEPELDRLKAHVTELSAPRFAGRRDVGAKLARDYLTAEFQKLQLAPLFEGSYAQDITGAEPSDLLGVNVGARLDPTGPEFANQWIILGAHYDHLGTINGVIYPGADDNASGVSMMLEVARAVVGSPPTSRRGIMFVGFDLEERGPHGEFGLRGSQFFAAHPPRPLDRVHLFVTADMIGRSLGGVCREDLFVLGSEREPEVRPWIRSAAPGASLRVNLLGADVLMIDRSDYGPFRARQVPYLFFTTGENPLYHSPGDVAATLDFPKLTAISQVIARVVRSASEATNPPRWAAEPDYPVTEARDFRHIFQTLLDHQADLKISPNQRRMMVRAMATADAVIARGTMTPEERNTIVRTAQLVLFTLF